MSIDARVSVESVIRRRPDALSATVKDEAVLMSVEKGSYYCLDHIGSDIWQRLEQPMAAGQLCAALCRAYEGDADNIERDVLALLRELAAAGLIDVDAA